MRPTTSKHQNNPKKGKVVFTIHVEYVSKVSHLLVVSYTRILTFNDPVCGTRKVQNFLHRFDSRSVCNVIVRGVVCVYVKRVIYTYPHREKGFENS